MELEPGSYGFDDLTCGAGFVTGWVEVSARVLVIWRGLAGLSVTDPEVPPLCALALIDGAKAAGPVQIRADAVVAWDLTQHLGMRAGVKLQGFYSVTELRAAGRARGVITLDLRVDDPTHATVLTGRTRLVAPRP